MNINDNTEELLKELEEIRSIKQELADMLVAFREYNERVLDIITED